MAMQGADSFPPTPRQTRANLQGCREAPLPAGRAGMLRDRQASAEGSPSSDY